MSSVLVLPPGPEYLLGYCGRGQARRDHRRRQRPTLGARARTCSIAGRSSCARRRRRGCRSPTAVDGAAAALPTCARRRVPRTLADDPDRAGRDHLHVGHHRAAQGRGLLQPPARVHHPDRHRRRVGHRRALVQRHVVRAPRLHDQAAGRPARRRHDVHHAALARGRRPRAARPREDDDGRRSADPARADAARPDVRRRSTSRACAYIIARRRPDHARPGRGSAPPLRRAARDALLVHRSRDRARHRVRRSRGGCDRQRRPAARERRARAADDADEPRRRAGEVGEVCLRSPAVHVGLLATTPSRPRPRSRADGFVRTGDLGWVDDQGRLRLVGRSKEMYVRGGYNVYPVEVESVLSTHPDVAAIAIVPRARRRDGRDRRGRDGARAIAEPRADARRAARVRRAEHVAAYKLPESAAVVRRRRCRSPRWRRSTGERWSASCRPSARSSSRRHGTRIHDRSGRAPRLDPRRARARRARCRWPGPSSRARRTPGRALGRRWCELGWPALDDRRGARRHRARRDRSRRSSPRSSAG